MLCDPQGVGMRELSPNLLVSFCLSFQLCSDLHCLLDNVPPSGATAVSGNSISPSRQKAQHGKLEARRVGIAGGVLECLLAGISRKGRAVGVAEPYVATGDMELQSRI